MIINNTSNSFVQYIDTSINENTIFNNNVFSDNSDDSLNSQNIFYNSTFSEYVDNVVTGNITMKDYEGSINEILSKNFDNYSSGLFFKSEKFQPRKIGTKLNTIYDDIKEFKIAVVEKLKSSINSEELEFGVIGNTTKDIEKFLLINKDYTINAITQYALDNFDNVNILYSVLHTIAHLDYNLISPTGATFALTASQHENIEIKDFAIQCFDMWESKDSLAYLKFIKIETSWLNDYLQEVIENIESLDG